MSTSSYLFPIAEASVEQEIKRSRFITHAAPANRKEEASQFIQNMRQQYPDARHHCWAYVACAPQGVHLGMSDDGEPQGTAGKPMFNVLQHKNIGKIVVVVIRYFGGIQLGTGGLVRAYASSVQQLLHVLPLKTYVKQQQICCELPYAFESQARHIIAQYPARILQVLYAQQVKINLEIEQQHTAALCQQLKDQSRGAVESQT